MSSEDRTPLPASDSQPLADKVVCLHDALASFEGGALVAFSGGTDSALLAYEAAKVLGPRALAVTADSPTLARAELEQARAFAMKHGIPHEVVETRELDNPSFVANDDYRCYHCKTELFGRMKELADEKGMRFLLFGAIGDDAGDWRTGMKAASDLGVRAPLMDAGFTKADVRQRSKDLGLETWDKPSSACLSSRFPSGRPINIGDLSRVERAEALLRANGFRQCRVRLMDEAARVEVEVDEIARLMDKDLRGVLVAGLKELGFRFVTLDLEGFRSGSLNPRAVEAPNGIRRNP